MQENGSIQPHFPQNKPAENSRVQVQVKAHEDGIPQWQPSFSSDGRSSLHDVWKLLEDESPEFTPRELHEADSLRPPEKSSTPESFTIKGKPSHVQPKPEITKPVLSAKAAGKWTQAQTKVKIRNYNVRDEDVRHGL